MGVLSRWKRKVFCDVLLHHSDKKHLRKSHIYFVCERCGSLAGRVNVEDEHREWLKRVLEKSHERAKENGITIGSGEDDE